MAKSEQWFWVDESSTFGGGESPIKCGDQMPKEIEEDERFESFKKEGKISTERIATKRELSELDKLREENIVLKNDKGELAKVEIDEALKTSVKSDLDEIAALKSKGGGSGITQAQLDTASGESVKADLERITELEEKFAELKASDGGELQGTLDLVKDAFVNIQQGDKKEEIWEAVKSVKDLLKEPEGEA